MTAPDYAAERVKYIRLLTLSREQIKAIENGDLKLFDRILKAKETTIKTLSNSKTLMAVDPAIAATVLAIHESEAQAEICLQARMDRVQERLKSAKEAAAETEGELRRKIETAQKKLKSVHKHEVVRTAYKRFAPFTPHGYDLRKDKTIPRFIDTTF